MRPRPSVDDFIAELDPAVVPEREIDQRTTQGVRGYLSAVRAHLTGLHRGGAPGRTVNEAHSDAVDRLIRRLVRWAEALTYQREGGLDKRISLAAVGGYARREMSFGSDVDLLFLHAPELDPLSANVAERIQYWLWDAGVTVGGAVRSVSDTMTLARQDATVGTAVLDARFLGGDAGLFHDFAEAVRKELMADPKAFVGSQRAALSERHAKFGESLYLLQPNLKDGAGGLRDYHVAHWVARATFPHIGAVEDLMNAGLLSEREMTDLREALDFLWRTRNQLHLMIGRKLDQMNFEHQEQIAETFGYQGDGGTLAVEGFMGDYYRHARTIGNLSEIVLEQCEARMRPPPAVEVARQVEEGFRIRAGHLEIPHLRHLRERPLRLLQAYAVAQRHDVPLSRTASRLVRHSRDRVDDAFRRDPAAAEVFLGILDGDRRVMRTLMAMNESGLLGAYLPEWDHIVCRWQHVMYHTYTVDVHSIFLVEELRRLWLGRYEHAQPELTELMLSVQDRPALFLGALLHDIGKGMGGDHSNKGERLARRCLERLGIEAERIDRACFLVRQHLLMSHLAQRRDLSEPRVIVSFARAVGDRKNLRNLYLITFADIRASSKAAWTEWKGQLLRELYERTADFLESGRDDPQRALEQIEDRVETRRGSARKELAGLGYGREKIDGFFDIMPRRYFVSHTPAQIARHARLVLGYDPKRPFETAVRERRGGFSEFLLCTHDVHGLFAKVAGCLTAVGINILGAHVYTTRSGLALEIYRVATPSGGEEERRQAWAELTQRLEAVLSGSKSVDELLRGRRGRVGRTAPPRSSAPAVTVTNEDSEFYTVVDVSANDRRGLLYELVSVIADHGLEIYISKAATILDQVADTFYLKDADRRKPTDPEALERLREALYAVVTRETGDV